MLRLTLIITALALAAGARCADARQRKAAARPVPQVMSGPSGPRASDKELRRLVGLVGVVEREIRSIDVVVDMMKQRMPNVPDKAWVDVKAEFVKSFNRESLVTAYARIYAAHFNAAEVRRLITFYSSPVGKKLVTETPLMETEAFLEGMSRGHEMGERLRELLKAKGYTVPST